jgi:hypothetical protein
LRNGIFMDYEWCGYFMMRNGFEFEWGWMMEYGLLVEEVIQ